MKPIFEEEIKKTKNQAILSYLGKLKGLTYSEIEQLKLITLWEAVESFNPEKGCLFSTHLYNKCRFAFLDHLRKKVIPVATFIEKSYEIKENILDILDELNPDAKMILHDRFVSRLSINEMVSKYKVTRIQIKNLINSSIDVLRTIRENDLKE